MAVNKDELLELFEQLSGSAQQSAYDFMKFLSTSYPQPDWDEITALEPDNHPLNTEEKEQLNKDGGFMSWEDAMDELNLSTDTKP